MQSSHVVCQDWTNTENMIKWKLFTKSGLNSHTHYTFPTDVEDFSITNLDGIGKNMAQEYLNTLKDPLSFEGVKLDNLYTLDAFFGAHSFAYCLNEDRRVKLVH